MKQRVYISLFSYVLFTLAFLSVNYFFYIKSTKQFDNALTIAKERQIVAQEWRNYQDEQMQENADDVQIESTPMVLINRQTDYLKEATVSYLKELELEDALSRLDNDALQDYTDYVLTNNNKKPVLRSAKNGKRRRKGRGRIVRRTSRRQRVVARNPGFFSLPLQESSFWLSSFFGPRRKPNGSRGFHYGIDMAAMRGTPVYAAADGRVQRAQWEIGYGNAILVQHDDKYTTRYAHLDKVYVRAGQMVKKGQKIGAVGDTGHTRASSKDASHLHFEVHEYGKQVNPLHFLSV